MMENKPEIMPLPGDTAWGRGWGVFRILCAGCEGIWTLVAPVGIKVQGACPYCKEVRSIDCDGFPNEIPHDGGWIVPRTREYFL